MNEKYYVKGGVHTGATFSELETTEKYGPFNTYNEALVEWRRKTFTQMLDNCYHRLYIVKGPIQGAEILRRHTRPDND